MATHEFDIVCVAQPAWDGPYAKSTVLLMKEIAKHHRVLYVDYAATWKDFFVALIRGDYKKVLRMLGLRKRLKTIHSKSKKITVLTLPPMLPLNFLPPGLCYNILNKLNGWIAHFSIRKAMQKLQFKQPVVINAFAPGLGLGLLKKLHERATLYYCYDEISQAAWNKKHGGELEKNFAEKANGVIVSSDALQHEKATLNNHTFLVKNGVDTEVFHPVDFIRKTCVNPVIGFVGSLDSRIDYDLLDELISNSPEFRFKFIGRIVDHGFDKLRSKSNVEWIPPVNYTHLPRYIQQFDIGIIPFVKSQFTEKIYPLKINEYLAMGKAVVMTSFAPLSEFNHLVEKADSAEIFKDKIRKCLESNCAEKIEERKEFAKDNSWQKRADEFCNIIEKVVCEK